MSLASYALSRLDSGTETPASGEYTRYVQFLYGGLGISALKLVKKKQNLYDPFSNGVTSGPCKRYKAKLPSLLV
jgi:hypothetical protein